MQNFTRSNCRSMGEEIAEVLNKYGFKNVEFGAGGSRFNQNECTFKIKAKIVGTLTRGETRLETMATRHGITDINKLGPKGERLTEFVDRRPRYPFGYVTRRGTQYKCTISQAIRKFA